MMASDNHIEQLARQLEVYNRIPRSRMEAANLLRSLSKENEFLLLENASLQAKIDAIMLEYCPDEMTKEQVDNWAKHQKQHG